MYAIIQLDGYYINVDDFGNTTIPLFDTRSEALEYATRKVGLKEGEYMITKLDVCWRNSNGLS